MILSLILRMILIITAGCILILGAYQHLINHNTLEAIYSTLVGVLCLLCWFLLRYIQDKEDEYDDA